MVQTIIKFSRLSKLKNSRTLHPRSERANRRSDKEGYEQVIDTGKVAGLEMGNISRVVVNNSSVIVIMNIICFATKRMSVFLLTPNLWGFFGVLAEIKKKMLNLCHNL